MSNDEDIYDDLPEETTSDYIAKIENKLESVQKKYDESQRLIKELNTEKHNQQKRIKELEKKVEDLERNISSLYKTAVAETKRKDNMLNELRAEHDDLAFRRRENYRNKSTNYNRDKSRVHRSIRERHHKDDSPAEEKYKHRSRITVDGAFYSRRLIEKKSKYDERLPTMKTAHSMNAADRLAALFDTKNNYVPRDICNSEHRNSREKVQTEEIPSSEKNELRNSQGKPLIPQAKHNLEKNELKSSQGKPQIFQARLHSDHSKLRSGQDKPLVPPSRSNSEQNKHHGIQEKQQLPPAKHNFELEQNGHHGIQGTQEKPQLLPAKPNIEQSGHPSTQEKQHLVPIKPKTSPEPVNILGNNLIDEILGPRNGHMPCEAALLSMKKQSWNLITPMKDTPDVLKEKFSQIENNKINAKIPMINEQRMLSPYKNVGVVEIICRRADEAEPSKPTESEAVTACSVTVSDDIEHGVFSRKSRKRPRIQKIVTGVKKIATC